MLFCPYNRMGLLQNLHFEEDSFCYYLQKDYFAPPGASFFAHGGKETKAPLGTAAPRPRIRLTVEKSKLPGACFSIPARTHYAAASAPILPDPALGKPRLCKIAAAPRLSKKPRRVSRPEARKEFNLFSPAACTSEKILLTKRASDGPPLADH